MNPDARTRDMYGRIALYPERKEEFTHASDLKLQSVMDVLSTEEGAAMALAAAADLRRRGEVLRDQAPELIESLFDVIRQSISKGDVNAVSAAKIIDVLFKTSGIADERAVRIRSAIETDKTPFSINIHMGPPREKLVHEIPHGPAATILADNTEDTDE